MKFIKGPESGKDLDTNMQTKQRTITGRLVISRQVEERHEVKHIKDDDSQVQVTRKEDIPNYTRILIGHLQINIDNVKSRDLQVTSGKNI